MAWDDPLSALEEVVTACADLDRTGAGTTREAVSVDRVVVAMPLELQSRTSERGEVILEASPPRQAMPTSVMPVLHRIRLVMEVER